MHSETSEILLCCQAHMQSMSVDLVTGLKCTVLLDLDPLAANRLFLSSLFSQEPPSIFKSAK